MIKKSPVLTNIVISIFADDPEISTYDEIYQKNLAELLLDNIIDPLKNVTYLKDFDEKNRNDQEIFIAIFTMFIERLKRENLIQKPPSIEAKPKAVDVKPKQEVEGEVNLKHETRKIADYRLGLKKRSAEQQKQKQALEKRIAEILPEIIAFHDKFIKYTAVDRALSKIIPAAFMPEKYKGDYSTEKSILVSKKIPVDTTDSGPIKGAYLRGALAYSLTQDIPPQVAQENTYEANIVITALRKELRFNTELVDRVASTPELRKKENLGSLINLTSGKTSAHLKLAQDLTATSFVTANFSTHPSNELTLEQIVQICKNQPAIISTILKKPTRLGGRNYRDELFKAEDSTLAEMYLKIPEARTAILNDSTLIWRMLLRDSAQQLADMFTASGPKEQTDTIKNYILADKEYTKKAFENMPNNQLISAYVYAARTLNEHPLNNAVLTERLIRYASPAQLLNLFEIQELREKIIQDKRPNGLLETVLDTASLGRTRSGSSGDHIARIYLNYPEIRKDVLAKQKVRENMLLFANVSAQSNDLLKLFELDDPQLNDLLLLKNKILKNPELINRMLTVKGDSDQSLPAHEITPTKLQKLYLTYPAIQAVILGNNELTVRMLSNLSQSELLSVFKKYPELQPAIIKHAPLCDQLLNDTSSNQLYMPGERLLVLFEKHSVLRAPIANNPALSAKMLKATPQEKQGVLFETYPELKPAVETASANLLAKKPNNAITRWWFRRSLSKNSGPELASLLLNAIAENSAESHSIRDMISTDQRLIDKILAKATANQLADLFVKSASFCEKIKADIKVATRMLTEISPEQLASLLGTHRAEIEKLDIAKELQDSLMQKMFSGATTEQFEVLLKQQPGNEISGTELIKRFTAPAPDHENIRNIIANDKSLIKQMLAGATGQQFFEIFLQSYFIKDTVSNAMNIVLQITDHDFRRGRMLEAISDEENEKIAEIYLLAPSNLREHISKDRTLIKRIQAGLKGELSHIPSELLLKLYVEKDPVAKEFILKGSAALKYKLLSFGITAKANLKALTGTDLNNAFAEELQKLTTKQKEQLTTLLIEEPKFIPLIFQREVEVPNPIHNLVSKEFLRIILRNAQPEELLALALNGQNTSVPIFTSSGRAEEILAIATPTDIENIFSKWSVDSKYLPRLFLSISETALQPVVDYVVQSSMHLQTLIAGTSDQDIPTLFQKYPQFRQEMLTNNNLKTFNGNVARVALLNAKPNKDSDLTLATLFLECPKEIRPIILQDIYLQQKMLFAATPEELKTLQKQAPELFTSEWQTYAEKTLAAVEPPQKFKRRAYGPPQSAAQPQKEITQQMLDKASGKQLATWCLESTTARAAIMRDSKPHGLKTKMLAGATHIQLTDLFLTISDVRDAISNDKGPKGLSNKMLQGLVKKTNTQLAEIFEDCEEMRVFILTDDKPNGLKNRTLAGLAMKTTVQLIEYLRNQGMRTLILSDDKSNGLRNRIFSKLSGTQLATFFLSYTNEFKAIILDDIALSLKERMLTSASASQLIALFLKSSELREIILADNIFGFVNKMLVNATGPELASLFLQSDRLREKIRADTTVSGLFAKMIAGAKNSQCAEIVINYYNLFPEIKKALQNPDFFARARMGAAENIGADHPLEATSPQQLFTLFVADPLVRELILNSPRIVMGMSSTVREASFETMIFSFVKNNLQYLPQLFLLDNVGNLKHHILDHGFMGTMLDYANPQQLTQIFLSGETKASVAIAQDKLLRDKVIEYARPDLKTEQLPAELTQVINQLFAQNIVHAIDINKMPNQEFLKALHQLIDNQINVLIKQMSALTEQMKVLEAQYGPTGEDNLHMQKQRSAKAEQCKKLETAKQSLNNDVLEPVKQLFNAHVVNKQVFEMEHLGLPYMPTPEAVAEVFMRPHISIFNKEGQVIKHNFVSTHQAKIYHNPELLQQLEKHAIELEHHHKTKNLTEEFHALLQRVAIIFVASDTGPSALPNQFQIMLRNHPFMLNKTLPQNVFEQLNKKLDCHRNDEKWERIRSTKNDEVKPPVVKEEIQFQIVLN